MNGLSASTEISKTVLLWEFKGWWGREGEGRERRRRGEREKRVGESE